MTSRYVCKKIVTAHPADKDGKPGYTVIYEDGYQSWSPKEVFEAGYEEIGHTGHLPAWHERLLAEGTLLCNNLERLCDYLESGKQNSLPDAQRQLLNQQRNKMTELLNILSQRAELLQQPN